MTADQDLAPPSPASVCERALRAQLDAHHSDVTGGREVAVRARAQCSSLLPPPLQPHMTLLYDAESVGESCCIVDLAIREIGIREVRCSGFGTLVRGGTEEACVRSTLA